MPDKYITRSYHDRKMKQLESRIKDLEADLRDKEIDATYYRKREKSLEQALNKYRDEEVIKSTLDGADKENKRGILDTIHWICKRVKPKEQNPAILIKALGNIEGLVCRYSSVGDQCYDPYPEEAEERKRKRAQETLRKVY